MFHSECISFEAKYVESKGETGGKPSDTSSLAVSIYLSDVGKVMENVLFWCYTI
jgi:hypothetical protein